MTTAYWIIESPTRGVFTGMDWREAGYVPTFSPIAKRNDERVSRWFTEEAARIALAKVRPRCANAYVLAKTEEGYSKC